MKEINLFVSSIKIMREFYQAKNLSKYKNLKHGFSTKAVGNLSWQTAKSEDKWFQTAAAHNKLAASFGLATDKIITTFQTHGKKISLIKSNQSLVLPTDALISSERGLGLLVHSADCLPILYYDPQTQSIAATHAGWRGVLNGIILETVQAFQKYFDSQPPDLLAAIGPSLGPCHFEVKDDVWSKFKKNFMDPQIFIKETQSAKGVQQLRLNLWLAARNQLLAAGLRKNSIEILEICTYCNQEEFPSYRRDNKQEDTFGALIALKS